MIPLDDRPHFFWFFDFAFRSDLWKIGEVKADMLPKSSALESRHDMPIPKKLQNEDFWKSTKEIVKKSQGFLSIFKKSIFREIGGPGQSQKGPPAPWNLGKISFLKTGDIPLRKQHISQWSDRFFSIRSFFQKMISKCPKNRIYKGGIASGKGTGLWLCRESSSVQKPAAARLQKSAWFLIFSRGNHKTSTWQLNRLILMGKWVTNWRKKQIYVAGQSTAFLTL